MAIDIVAAPGRCEEASLFSSSVYLPCGAPAMFVVGWKGRDDKPIRMCAACADHNVRNRGGFIVAPTGAPESDASFRLRILWSGHKLSELDSFAVITVTGEGLDEVGRHVGMKREGIPCGSA